MQFINLISLLTVVAALAPTTYFTGSLTSQVYKRNDGWALDKPVKVYTFENPAVGTISDGIITAPIYLFRRDNQLMSTAVQPNLIGVAPGDEGYSDLWKVNIVTVPASFTQNITNVNQLNQLIDAKNVTVTPTELLVNCPVVHPTSTLELASDGKSVTGFYKDQLIHYFDFGVNGSEKGNNSLQKVFVIVDSNGKEVGEHVFPGTPSEPGYTAFWYVTKVTVDSKYVANQYRNDGDVSKSKNEVVMPLKIVNCPIVSNGTAMPFKSSATGTAAASLYMALGSVLIAVSLL